MATWTSDELRKIAKAEELTLASVGRDGVLGRPVTIWMVAPAARATTIKLVPRAATA